MLLMHWCCWCADADAAADALMLLMHWCCWCADAADALMLLMRWCCWCADAADVLMLLMHQCYWTRIRTCSWTFLEQFAQVDMHIVIPKTCDLWHIWSEWWGDIAWPIERQWQRHDLWTLVKIMTFHTIHDNPICRDMTLDSICNSDEYINRCCMHSRFYRWGQRSMWAISASLPCAEVTI